MHASETREREAVPTRQELKEYFGKCPSCAIACQCEKCRRVNRWLMQQGVRS